MNFLIVNNFFNTLIFRPMRIWEKNESELVEYLGIRNDWPMNTNFNEIVFLSFRWRNGGKHCIFHNYEFICTDGTLPFDSNEQKYGWSLQERWRWKNSIWLMLIIRILFSIFLNVENAFHSRKSIIEIVSEIHIEDKCVNSMFHFRPILRISTSISSIIVKIITSM